MQLEFTSRHTANVHLPSFEFSSAKCADSLVVERMPTPKGIGYTQNREPIIEIEVSDHLQ